MSGLGNGKTGRALGIRFFAALCDYYDDVTENFVESELDWLDDKVMTEDQKDPANPQYFNVKADKREYLARLANAHNLNDSQIEIDNEIADNNRKITSNDITYLLTRLAGKKYNIFVFPAASYTVNETRKTGEEHKNFLVKRKYKKTNRRRNLKWLANIWNKNSKSLSKKKSVTKEQDYWISRIKAFQSNSFHFDLASNKFNTDFPWDSLPLIDLGLVKLKQENRNIVDRISKDTHFKDTEKVEISQKYEHQAFLEEVLNQGETPKGLGNSIIIGEPGAGKTTLLQQIHRTILDKEWGYPIWVSLKELDAISTKDHGEQLLQFIYNDWLKYVLKDSFLTKSGKKQLEEEQEDLKALFRDERKRIWLLLDGLDEMTITGVQSSFSAIQKKIDNLKELSPYRIILTCRQNLWNSYDTNDLRGFDTFCIQKFNLKQAKQFIKDWFGADSKSEYGSELIKKLKNIQNQNLRYLVSNPLLLAMLCVVYERDYEKQNALPETRGKLYQEFIPHYHRWKNKEFEITRADKSTIENEILPKIALWNFENSSSRYLFPEDDLRKFLKKEFSWSEIELNIWLTKVENTWLQRVGFVKQDKTQAAYCFFHLTFQEYFAAKGIDDWDFILPKNHRNKPVERNKYRIFDKKWSEIIIFWISREEIELEEREKFIKALFDFDDGINTKFIQYYYKQSLLVAGYCIGEFDSKLSYDIYRKMYLNGVHQNDKNCYNEQLAIALIEILKDNNAKQWMRINATVSLGLVAHGNSTAIAALIEILKDNNAKRWMRINAAISLGQLAHSNPTVITALIEILNDEKAHERVRQEASISLGRLEPGNSTAIAALIEILENEKAHERIRQSAFLNLVYLAPGNPTAIAAFIGILKNEKANISVRWDIFTSLGKLAPGNPTVIEVLIEILKDEETSERVRLSAASSLGKLAPGNPTAIEVLIEILKDEETSERVRLSAASSLGQLAPDNSTTIEALIEILKDEETGEWSRYSVAKSLGQLAPSNPTVIEVSIEILKDENAHERVRRSAATILGNLEPDNSATTITALIEVLENDHGDVLVRHKAASILGKLAPGNSIAIATLIEIIKNEKATEFIRHKAAWSLGQISNLAYPQFYNMWHFGTIESSKKSHKLNTARNVHPP